MVPGRLGLLVTLFLCMVNTLNTVASTSPRPDEGASALVNWILLCLAAILSAMAEYAVILAIQMREKSQKVISSDDMTGRENMTIRAGKRLDVASLILFPAGFFITSLVLWTRVYNTQRLE